MADDVFDLDAALADKATEYPPFEFTYGGESYQLPSFWLLSPGQIDRLEKAAGLDELKKVLAEFDSDVAEAFPEIPTAGGQALFERWRAHAEEALEDGDAGKDSGQSSPPNRAARRSKQTSQAKGGRSQKSRSGSSKAK